MRSGGVIVCMGIEVFEIRPRTFKGLGEGWRCRETEVGGEGS